MFLSSPFSCSFSLCKGRTLYSVVRDAKIVLDVNKTRQIAQEIVKVRYGVGATRHRWGSGSSRTAPGSGSEEANEGGQDSTSWL